MQVHGPHGPQGASPIFPQRPIEPAETARSSGLEAPQDEIQISPEARLLAEISQTHEIRQERIDEIRSMIASGVYETPEKLSIAVNRLLESIAATDIPAE